MKNAITFIRSILLLAVVFSMTKCTSDIDDNIAETTNSNPLPKETIIKNSELFNLLERVTTDEADPLNQIVCVDFIYPLTILIYDFNFQVLGSQSMNSDQDFSSFLGALPANQPVSISYPISTILADGTTFSVNNNTELKLAIDNCSQNEIITFCNGIFSGDNPTTGDPSCASFVKYIDTQYFDNKYVSGTFLIDSDGTLVFHYNGIAYQGSWQFLFVDHGQLHLNINLEGTSQVALDWNIDRPIYFADGNIVIDNPDPAKDIMLQKYCQEETVYAIGDTGPANGIVFYDKGSYSEGWRYMEVALTEMGYFEWGCSATAITAATATGIGKGYFNTAAIVNYHDSLINYYLNPAVCNPSNNGTVAAKNAILFSNNDIDGWFLPSLDELQLIYVNLHQQGLGGFASGIYWSSTALDAAYAKTIDFTNGAIYDTAKTPLPNTVRARAIRYF